MSGDAEPQPKAVIDHVAAVTGSAAGAKNEHLQNVGPSVQYRIIGEDGQAHEFTNYMLPMMLDGSSRSEEHTSELQSLMRISYAVFCLKKKKKRKKTKLTNAVKQSTSK